jgi:membrane protease YdiL (CAAX protease family)
VLLVAAGSLVNAAQAGRCRDDPIRNPRLSLVGDNMDPTILLIIIIIVLLIGGGGWYGRGRWFDPNTNRRSDRRDDIRYTRWIIGGVVVLAIVIAAAVFTSTGNKTAQTTTPVPAPAPSKTGSDTAPLAPANR